MKKIMILVGALLISVVSHAIWFHTSCGISVEVSSDQFKDGQEVADYMQWLENNLCTQDQEAPEEP
ncbi:MAG: hypothetical protein IJX29_07255 [Bacteroides sp.]|nr:hypothetical protein [Bacteroides sp.]